MKVSIITPSYNSERFILETYNSLLEQTHTNWEWLVTDDCSSDNTYKIVNEIAKKDERVKLASNLVNSGAAIARNKSLSRASGDFIAFLDSDDKWLPTKLAKQIEFMNDKNIDFCFTAYTLVDVHGLLKNEDVDVKSPKSVCYSDMLKKKATIGCSTVMLRRLAFKYIEMPDIRTGQDYVLWISLLKTGAKAFKLQEVLTMYRIVPGSISRNKFKKALRQWEIYRKIERVSFIRSIWYFTHYGYRAVIRR
ncbi:glycosyl transferase family 2 [Serratia fonticola]|uniref:glycosyltransferase family 2 protein n=1 Tax=Serratia fonticola TaxID=47917 RepID=UPI0007430A01|nr:glycosyltransferase family 2 protein [Serratia fonticola]ALX94358.1 glycosyl transferase family 2 [Serratia fonticola]CAI1562968.1 Hyaluronan synthase [Serratia fonticola]